MDAIGKQSTELSEFDPVDGFEFAETIIHGILVIPGNNADSSWFKGGGGAVAQSVERTTPGEEVPGSILAVAARSLLVGSVSV